jgi:HK97 gp10 family phage protein
MPAKLTSRIPQIQASLPVRVGGAIRAGTERIEQRAKAAAPDRPPLGEGLVESIEARDGEDGYGIYAAWYWHFNEFGTTTQPARPFMLPAAEAEVDNIQAGVVAVLRKL